MDWWYTDKYYVGEAGNNITTVDTVIGTASVKGMVGSQGVSFNTPLNPLLHIQDNVQLESKYWTMDFSEVATGITGASGRYIMQTIKHTGDTHEDIWQTEVTGLESNTGDDTA